MLLGDTELVRPAVPLIVGLRPPYKESLSKDLLASLTRASDSFLPSAYFVRVVFKAAEFMGSSFPPCLPL